MLGESNLWISQFRKMSEKLVQTLCRWALCLLLSGHFVLLCISFFFLFVECECPCDRTVQVQEDTFHVWVDVLFGGKVLCKVEILCDVSFVDG